MDAVREQAAFWVIERQSDDEKIQANFESWLGRDPLHRKVFGQMEQLWLAVDPAEQQQRARRKRKQLAGGATLCLLGLALTFFLPWQYWSADYKTQTGQISTVKLADGSTAILNSNSAINVIFDGSHRSIELVRGEVMFDVRKDKQQRRFIVTTPQANAEALGTAYSVEIAGDITLVTVHESEVRVTGNQHEQEVRLKPGQQAKVGEKGIETLSRELPEAPDWAQGDLVFNRVPVQDVIARLNQYHPGVLRLLDAGDDRLFTGVLPAQDSDSAVNLFAQSMGMEIQKFTPYLTLLKPGK